MTARVGLTFVPLLLLGNMRSKKIIQKVDKWGIPNAEQKKEDMLRGIRQRTILFHILIFIPLILYWATIIASLERTPLTGRYGASLSSRRDPPQPHLRPIRINILRSHTVTPIRSRSKRVY